MEKNLEVFLKEALEKSLKKFMEDFFKQTMGNFIINPEEISEVVGECIIVDFPKESRKGFLKHFLIAEGIHE